MSWLVSAATWALAWLRWIVAPWLALTLFATALEPNRQASLVKSWLRQACTLRLLALATVWFVIFIALPWRLALWRPGGLPPTWIEAPIAGLRLLIAALLMTIGALLIIRTAVRRRGNRVALANP
ncbi:MAG: hypothetical protein ABR606_04590 [Vicinamibacterales bacterium]